MIWFLMVGIFLVILLLGCASAAPKKAALPTDVFAESPVMHALASPTGNCADPYIRVKADRDIRGGGMQDVVSVEHLETACDNINRHLGAGKVNITLNDSFKANVRAGRPFALGSSDHWVIPYENFINERGERFNIKTHAVVSCIIEYADSTVAYADRVLTRRNCSGPFDP